MEAGLSAGQQMAAVTDFSSPTPFFSLCCFALKLKLKLWALIRWQTVSATDTFQTLFITSHLVANLSIAELHGGQDLRTKV